ncbi:MAG TPA: hypothetical protein VI980_00970 [Acidimicrobiia bacterium]|nr:hypothetical protein [Acidimicrobiia bacterium]
MSENRDYTESELLALLRQGLDSTDPVPADVNEFAMAALTWRTIEAELAEIAFDSASEETLAGVRGSAGERMLSFETTTLTIDIEYRSNTRRVIGQVAPPQPATIELHHSKGTLTTVADDLGRFSFDDVDPGPVSIVCTSHGDHPDVVKTEWTVL